MEAMNQLIHKSMTILKENSTVEPPLQRGRADADDSKVISSVFDIQEYKDVEQVDVDDIDDIVCDRKSPSSSE